MKEEDTFQRKKKKLNELETSNPPVAKFETLVIRMFSELGKRIGELSENLHKEIETTKTIITEIKATLERINGKLDETENQYVGRQGSRKHSIGTAKI